MMSPKTPTASRSVETRVQATWTSDVRPWRRSASPAKYCRIRAAHMTSPVPSARGLPSSRGGSPDCFARCMTMLPARSTSERGQLRQHRHAAREGIGRTSLPGRRQNPCRGHRRSHACRLKILKYFAGEALRRHGQTWKSTRPGLEFATYREAARCGRAHHAVELPDRHPRLEAAPGAGVRQHRGAQAGQRSPGGARALRPNAA